MAECSSREKREISYFGPFYINNNCIELPIETKENGNSIETVGLGKEVDHRYVTKTTQTTKHHRTLSPKRWLENVGRGMALIRHDKHEKNNKHEKHEKRGQNTDRTFISYKDEDNEVEYVLKRLDKAVEKETQNSKNLQDMNTLFPKVNGKDNKNESKKDSVSENTKSTCDKYNDEQSQSEANGINTCAKHELEVDRYIDETNENQNNSSYDETVKSGYEEINKLWYGTTSGTIPKEPGSTLSQQYDSTENKFTERIPAKKQVTVDNHKKLRGKKDHQDGKEYYATESRAALRRYAKTASHGLHRRYASDGLLDVKNLNNLFERDATKRWSHGQALESCYVKSCTSIVAIDFGTTYSGYAYCFTYDPDNVHMMRKIEGGDPGIFNQKTPTSILLTPEGNFHSFGFAARDFYHDLDQKEAAKWLYFERFKMLLHTDEGLTMDATVFSSTGKEISAMKLFSYGLAFFKDHALQELSDQSGMRITSNMIKWVITVPAIWKASAKQFMRQAAYNAGVVSPDRPGQLLIALEPEAASIYCRGLRLLHVAPNINADDSISNSSWTSSQELPSNFHNESFISNDIDIGTRYMIVDCGGGTTDITVHEIDTGGRLKEIHKASGGPYGSLGIDREFELLLYAIFGKDLMEQFKLKRPTGWVDLMIAFESRKRSAGPYRSTVVTVSFPFSFIDFYKKCKGSDIENAVKKYGDREITWASSGILRLSPGLMRRLFLPTISRIKQEIGNVLNHQDTRGLSYLFLVGGFAESSMLQHEIRKDFGHILKVIIPQGVDTTIVKGAVMFGMDPDIVSERRSRLTYGVGVLHRFKPEKHPITKKVRKDGIDWCTDILDGFVLVDQAVAPGDTVVRSYTPVRRDQTSTVIHIYSSERKDAIFITDKGVKQCGTLRLELESKEKHEKSGRCDCQDQSPGQSRERREIRASMIFGDTEIKVTAVDTKTGRSVHAYIDFLNT